ncbi:stress-induced protein [Pigmentiphaga aceris]|uniref:Stress-induced protein n=1 Tax=Pigmentiphaga aceris TaxID=1940612 RepID=A0A5C0B305_9BURK|nr:KGG domain-containing protein [Pigmentiphaga aceris]QEI08645.1 stress-induced protein [Pigmentiphaga aceris]
MATTTRSGRGFASMDPQRQREISAQGGRAAHRSGNAHEFDSREAALAGAKSRSRRQQQQQAAIPADAENQTATKPQQQGNDVQQADTKNPSREH